MATDVLRLDVRAWDAFAGRLAASVVLAVILQLFAGLATQLYRVRWRIASFEEFIALAYTYGVVSALLLGTYSLDPSDVLPPSVLIAAGAIALVTSAAARSTWRVWWERTHRPTSDTPRAIVLGAGQAGIHLVHSLLVTSNSPYLPVALLDDDPMKRRMRVRQLRVHGGLDDLTRVTAEVGAQVVIVAVPSADSAFLRRVSDLASSAGIQVRVLPPVHGILDDPVSLESIRPLEISDLLGRRVVTTDIDSIAGYLQGKSVLVTGAGGSIGSELCRQLARFEPAALVMLDRDESALHAVQLSIEGRALLDTRNLVVCDIRDTAALADVFAEHRPEVVFHAAALKHLPLLEMWPAEALKTNVVGTQNVLNAALAAGVQRFVNISTDKAANPSSILGYSKRIAERLTAASATVGTGAYLSVRFGNVLGSRGSVLTTFREQVANGGPVTVTHPDVSRFFMTVSEAVELVIQAGAVGEDGEVLILDMGQPVRIADVAKRLIDESGIQVDLVYTGLRPGEKLHEELFGYGELDRRPKHPLISQSSVPPLAETALEELLSLRDTASLAQGLSELSYRDLDTDANLAVQ